MQRSKLQLSIFLQNDNLPTQLQSIHSPHVVSIKFLAKDQSECCTIPCRHQTPGRSSMALIWVATHIFISSIPLPQIRLSSRMFLVKVCWFAVDMTGRKNAGMSVLHQIRKDILPFEFSRTGLVDRSLLSLVSRIPQATAGR